MDDPHIYDEDIKIYSEFETKPFDEEGKKFLKPFFIVQNKDSEEYQSYYHGAFGKRPAEELFDICNDRFCLTNLAEKEDFAKVKNELSKKLESLLKTQGDSRVLGKGDLFESYPRFGVVRPELGGFAERGKYNPAFQRSQK